METLSDRLDILDKISEEKERKIIAKLNAIDKRECKKIVTQFNKAKKVLGHRFTMEKVHSNMFKFYFQIEGCTSLHCYISKGGKAVSNPTWFLTEYCFNLEYDHRKLYNKFRNKYESHTEGLKTKKLSDILIEFVHIYYEGIAKEIK